MRYVHLTIAIGIFTFSLSWSNVMADEKSTPQESTNTPYFPNAVELMGTTYYVAQNDPKGSDDNPGTKELPFKTISKAGTVADQGDFVMIDEGVYREEVLLPKNGFLYVPWTRITYKALPGKRVYLKGSDVFEPKWEAIGGGVYKAALPAGLFKKDAYNPYELSCVIDDPKKVRPIKGEVLPETLGQIYVDGKAFEQLAGMEAVKNTAGSFVVTGNGKEIVVHFPDGKTPAGKLVELTVRQRCFKPMYPPVGDEYNKAAYMETWGMVVEHAAEPGAFCYFRPLSIRKNGDTGIIVRKSFSMRGLVVPCSKMTYNPAYISKDKPTIIASMVDDLKPAQMDEWDILTLNSDNLGKTWEIRDRRRPDTSREVNHFFDEDNGMVIKYYRDRKRKVVFEVSSDEGKTWSSPEGVDFRARNSGMLKLDDGSLFLPGGPDFTCYIGKWRPDLSGIDWERRGTAKRNPALPRHGLSEPHAVQLPDGRIFVIFRTGATLSSQEKPGTPSVKLFTVSEDGGKTWSDVKPLTYEDGSYVYSPASFPDVIRSIKNNKVYVLLNISPKPTSGCDPRSTLHIAELDPATLGIKRDTIAIIDTKHYDHYPLVRFSNWARLQDRDTKNLVLFLKLHLSEHCPIRMGYDYGLYRYEIEFPD
ncbi:MAG TPA: hypothetical protein ENH84_00370 [Phycisphaerae bacterium]|nr:hypothetical protein [Phycisphaerae bacterium]